MPAPQLDRKRVVALGQTAFESDAHAVVYADCEPRAPGRVPVGTETVETAHDTLLVFRDENPGANWMHPCAYALIDLVTSHVIAVVRSDRPPVFGQLPGTWIVVSDPGGRADLIPSARHEP